MLHSTLSALCCPRSGTSHSLLRKAWGRCTDTTRHSSIPSGIFSAFNTLSNFRQVVELPFRLGEVVFPPSVPELAATQSAAAAHSVTADSEVSAATTEPVLANTAQISVPIVSPNRRERTRCSPTRHGDRPARRSSSKPPSATRHHRPPRRSRRDQQEASAAHPRRSVRTRPRHRLAPVGPDETREDRNLQGAPAQRLRRLRNTRRARWAGLAEPVNSPSRRTLDQAPTASNRALTSTTWRREPSA